MNRNLSIVSAVLFGALTLSAVGCASPAASDASVLDDSEGDDRADGTGTPLQNRATWMKRLDACKADFDETAASPDVYVAASALSVYGDCLTAANNRVLGRIGRNIASFQHAFEPPTPTDLQNTFGAYHDEASAFCGYVTGYFNPTITEDIDPRVASLSRAAGSCFVAAELALAKEIANGITWADATEAVDDAVFAQYLGDLTPSLDPVKAPVCEAELDKVDDQGSELEYTTGYYAYSECVIQGGIEVISSMLPKIVPELDGAAAEDYMDQLAGAWRAITTRSNDVCRAITLADEYTGGGKIGDLMTSVCVHEQNARFARAFEVNGDLTIQGSLATPDGDDAEQSAPENDAN